MVTVGMRAKDSNTIGASMFFSMYILTIHKIALLVIWHNEIVMKKTTVFIEK
jgi:hypothetical protein